MVALVALLAALSHRADRLLERYHHVLFHLGLDVTFNRATLATKYWLPLPESDEPAYRTDAPEDEHPPNESDKQLSSALGECERILQQFESSLESACKRPLERSVESSSETPRLSRLEYAVG